MLNNAWELSTQEEERECLALRSDLKRMLMNGTVCFLIEKALRRMSTSSRNAQYSRFTNYLSDEFQCEKLVSSLASQNRVNVASIFFYRDSIMSYSRLRRSVVNFPMIIIRDLLISVFKLKYFGKYSSGPTGNIGPTVWAGEAVTD